MSHDKEGFYICSKNLFDWIKRRMHEEGFIPLPLDKALSENFIAFKIVDLDEDG